MFGFFKKQKHSRDKWSALRQRVNADIDSCNLSQATQRGFLFIMGAAYNSVLNENDTLLKGKYGNENERREVYTEVLNGYSACRGNFEEYGDLSDGVFMVYLYNANHVIYDVMSNGELRVDTHLRSHKIRGTNIVHAPLIADVDKALVSKYKGRSHNLSTCYNLCEEVFSGCGEHLLERGYSNQRAYEVGYAFFCLKHGEDADGINFLLNSFYRILPPLYRAICRYPIFHFLEPRYLPNNHLFTNTLNELILGKEQRIVEVVQEFHRSIYYEENNGNYKADWELGRKEHQVLQAQTFINGCYVYQTYLNTDKSVFQKSGAANINEVINARLDKAAFFNHVAGTINAKYGMVPVGGGAIWNNDGEVLTYLAILFYETVSHAIVVEDITDL